MKTSATLRITGATLDPSRVTQELSAIPTYVHEAGKSRSAGGRELKPDKFGLWALKVTDDSDVSVSERIAMIFSILSPSALERIFDLQGVEHAWIDAHVILNADEREVSSFDLFVDSDVIAKMGRARLALETTVTLAGSN